jgi:HNH endonuclease
LNSNENEQFTQHLLKAADQAVHLGYRPTRFKQMLNTYGGFDTIKRILMTGKPSDGFITLLGLGRVDLTCEAIIVESHWRQFFDEDLLQRSEALLASVGYKFQPFTSTEAAPLPTESSISIAERLGLSAKAEPKGTSAFFAEDLRAPLANVRWSWGSVDEVSRRVFLRLWEEDLQSHDGRTQIFVLDDKDTHRLGWQERQRHVALMERGYAGYGVICRSQEGGEGIAAYDSSQLIRLGTIHDRDECRYADVMDTVPVQSFRYTSPTPEEIAEDVTQVERNVEDATTRTALIQARVGQGQYRARLEGLWDSACAVTGCSVRAVLRASHCKPWRLSDDEERLNAENGLLLSANLDALFDAGLVSFDDEGRMLVADQVSVEERQLLNLPNGLRKRPTEALASYLKYHRELIFSKPKALQ